MLRMLLLRMLLLRMLLLVRLMFTLRGRIIQSVIKLTMTMKINLKKRAYYVVLLQCLCYRAKGKLV